MMRQRAMERKNEDMEVMEVEEEGKSVEDSESESEYEEYTDSEDEAEPRLKPVFIRKYELKLTNRNHDRAESDVMVQSVITLICFTRQLQLCTLILLMFVEEPAVSQRFPHSSPYDSCYCLTCVPPQSNSPPAIVPGVDHRGRHPSGLTLPD